MKEKFDYTLNYKNLNLRKNPELYRVGIGEQGVLLVEPYKSEILPYWRFKTPQIAQESATHIKKIFYEYMRNEDFVGMDMARKFLQMGYTRSRRYANHKSGKKYDEDFILPSDTDDVKALSAEIFYKAWQDVEKETLYKIVQQSWKICFG